jgi:hypothetical protein
LASNLKFIETEIQKVTESPEEKRKMEALRKCQKNVTSGTPEACEKPNVVADRPVLIAKRRLLTFGQTMEPNQVQTEGVEQSNTEGPLDTILGSMKPRSLRVNTTKPATVTSAAARVTPNRPTGSKLIKPTSTETGHMPGEAKDMKVSFEVTAPIKTEIQQIDFYSLNAQAVHVRQSKRLFGRRSSNVPEEHNATLHNEQNYVHSVCNTAQASSPAEFSFVNASAQHQISVEQELVQGIAAETIEKSGRLFGYEETRNLFGKQGNSVVTNQVTSASGSIDFKNQCVPPGPVFDLEPKRPEFRSGTSSLSSPEAMQEEITFVPIYRPITPELPMDSAQFGQGMDSMMHHSQVFQTPDNAIHARSALSDPLPLGNVMNISAFEAALGIGNQTFTEDMIELMDVDQGPDMVSRYLVSTGHNVFHFQSRQAWQVVITSEDLNVVCNDSCHLLEVFVHSRPASSLAPLHRARWLVIPQ